MNMLAIMKFAIIGRTEILYNVAEHLQAMGHDIDCVLTAKAAPEYTRTAKDFHELAKRYNAPFSLGGQIKYNY